MSYALGIDLGTTNSVVSILRRGFAETIPIVGRTTFPSVISFRQDGSLLAGQPAKAHLLLDPENSVASAKRFVGDRAKIYHVGGRFLTPVDVSSLILKRLVEGARSALGEEVWDAVITVPAYFTDAQREDTKRAGEEAGLNVLRLIPEPTAAAMAYGVARGKDQTIMVYDLGGGTFDVSILEIKGNKFEVKAVGGDSRLGGDDFDEAIMRWAGQRFQEQTVDIMGDTSREGMIARQRLKETAEIAKMELSVSDQAEISIPEIHGTALDLTITLDQFNDLICPLLDRTVQHMRTVLRDARMEADDIDRVILVGGSTKVRAVCDTVAREVKDPFTSERVDEVVSHGAAIVAASLFLPEEDLLPIEFSDVTAHSLGVDVLNEKSRVVFQAIIKRQTSYPCTAGFLGCTNHPHQNEVHINVFRGEEPYPEGNTHLGQLVMPVSPTQYDPVLIVSLFHLDADGIIHFTAVQLPTDYQSESILRYALEHKGEVDVSAVTALIDSGAAKSKTVTVKSI